MQWKKFLILRPATETALTRIHNDLLMAMNRRQVSALVLLDLSAAFDTLDHQILLDRLKLRFGISKVAHSLLSPYLSNRSQSILVTRELSTAFAVFPRGQVLVPYYLPCILLL